MRSIYNYVYDNKIYNVKTVNTRVQFKKPTNHDGVFYDAVL